MNPAFPSSLSRLAWLRRLVPWLLLAVLAAGPAHAGDEALRKHADLFWQTVSAKAEDRPALLQGHFSAQRHSSTRHVYPALLGNVMEQARHHFAGGI